ncbi:MAG: hypothetical protein AAF366_12170 [Pseudomonadota bacterium]
MTDDVKTTIQRLERAESHDDSALIGAAQVLMAYQGKGGAPVQVAMDDLSSTDAVLHLIDDIVPGWTIRIKGKAMEPDGHWQCTLRRSSARDNDEFIGAGRGKVLSHALVSALLATVNYIQAHDRIA